MELISLPVSPFAARVRIAIYAKGPWSHLFDGTVEQNYIFHVMDYAVKGGAQ